MINSNEYFGALIAAERVLRAMNYDHGFFNVETYYRPAHDDIKVIEINPRMASQLANLYRRVDGYDPHDALLELSVGERPQIASGAGSRLTETGRAQVCHSRRRLTRALFESWSGNQPSLSTRPT